MPVANTSGVKGVTYDKQRKKWRLQKRHLGKNQCIGLYDSIKDAARAYRIFLKEIGEKP